MESYHFVAGMIRDINIYGLYIVSGFNPGQSLRNLPLGIVRHLLANNLQ